MVHLSTSFAVVPTVLLICASVLAHLSLRTQSQMQCRGMPTQVYSDVDDTLMCSNNKHPGGGGHAATQRSIVPGGRGFSTCPESWLRGFTTAARRSVVGPPQLAAPLHWDCTNLPHCKGVQCLGHSNTSNDIRARREHGH